MWARAALAALVIFLSLVSGAEAPFVSSHDRYVDCCRVGLKNAGTEELRGTKNIPKSCLMMFIRTGNLIVNAAYSHQRQTVFYEPFILGLTYPRTMPLRLSSLLWEDNARSACVQRDNTSFIADCIGETDRIEWKFFSKPIHKYRRAECGQMSNVFESPSKWDNKIVALPKDSSFDLHALINPRTLLVTHFLQLPLHSGNLINSAFPRIPVGFIGFRDGGNRVRVLNLGGVVSFRDSVISGVYKSMGLESRASSEQDSENKQSYRNLFTKGALVIVGLILTLCAFKSISYAVDRSKISFVLFALVLQAGGVAALLYVAWLPTAP